MIDRIENTGNINFLASLLCSCGAKRRVKAYPFGSKEPHSMHEGFRTLESKRGIMLMSCY